MVMTREEPKQFGVGGDGGTGLGLSLPSPLVSLDKDLRGRIPDVDTEEFCKEHGLGDDIRELLAENEYDGTDSLFVEKESKLQELGFQIGHIAELRWALKKLLLKKFPERALRNSREGYRPDLYGGLGGAGGYGGQKGGAGGTGHAPELDDTRDAFWFNRMGGKLLMMAADRLISYSLQAA
ncbi:hypothetical protein DFH08DRAFT_845849 [Mycena albidolilacea]|uniref:Uncharacterized protein n=1 Tax=Mycena albidolilacea TaxID=1033008 RepID=A0AAD7AHZ0_9AGAR|nr:hypothetical protein DFH08DRAFT_845849 [Mycena albidolilacea]